MIYTHGLKHLWLGAAGRRSIDQEDGHGARATAVRGSARTRPSGAQRESDGTHEPSQASWPRRHDPGRHRTVASARPCPDPEARRHHRSPTLGPAPFRPLSPSVLQDAYSFTHSRLVKYKSGPGVVPGTFAIEGDLAESWSQPDETTYVFKLRRGARWHQIGRAS